MKELFHHKKACFVIAIFLLFSLCAVVHAKDEKAEITYKELSEMEALAEKGRQSYWRGDYQDAIKIFEGLSSTTHPSLILYLNELGKSYLAAGDYLNAERCFMKVYKLLETYIDQKREKKALSKFGKEEEKIYYGDPYEQATSLLLLSLFFINRGDFDNALAALTTAILSDSDATENMYDSDYTLLHLLQAKISLLKGNNDKFIKNRDLAIESYRITHPEVRTLFSERLDKIALLKMPPDKRKKIGVKETDEELKTQIFELDKRIKASSESIDARTALGPMYEGDYNTLLIIPIGRAPYKSRRGKDAQLVTFEGVNIATQPFKLTLDGKSLNSIPISNVADIEFQATTRGGRRMDAILQGKAAFRSTTVDIGRFITDVGNQTGGLVGLGLVVIGAITQGVGGAVTPEGDTRSWKTLPQSYVVFALNLPEGEHTIQLEQDLYFEARNKIVRTITIRDKNDMTVVFGAPSLVGLYSVQSEQDIKLSKKDLDERDKVEQSLIIAPPLGMSRIERFGCKIKDDVEVCAPDVKQVMREIRESLKKRNIPACFATHKEILDRKDEFSSKSKLAFQIALKDLETEKINGERVYRTTFDLALINTKTGERVISELVTGTCNFKKSDPTKGFYGGLESALSQFIASDKFGRAMSKYVSIIH